jgi:hypothetical protein
MANLPSVLAFEDVQFDIVDRNGVPWLRLADVARALYADKGGDTSVTPFEHAVRSVRRLYEANADEFTPEMTQVLDLPTPGGPQATRIFSPRGCHLLAMLARTERAKRFRRWVLDVLEGAARPALAPPRTYGLMRPAELIPPEAQVKLPPELRSRMLFRVNALTARTRAVLYGAMVAEAQKRLAAGEAYWTVYAAMALFGEDGESAAFVERLLPRAALRPGAPDDAKLLPFRWREGPGLAETMRFMAEAWGRLDDVERALIEHRGRSRRQREQALERQSRFVANMDEAMLAQAPANDEDCVALVRLAISYADEIEHGPPQQAQRRALYAVLEYLEREAKLQRAEHAGAFYAPARLDPRQQGRAA